jgi:hypothetical protein
MARKIHVQLIDDLSGQDADETIRFSLDSADHEIDLTADHATELRGILEKYVAHARRLRGTPSSPGARAAPTGRDETQRIRDRAKANGYNPSARDGSARTSKRPTTQPRHKETTRTAANDRTGPRIPGLTYALVSAFGVTLFERQPSHGIPQSTGSTVSHEHRPSALGLRTGNLR